MTPYPQERRRLWSIMLPAALVFVASSATAETQSLKLVGSAGYLSEWEVSGTISSTHNEFAGPLTWKHVGFCSNDGPQEKSGSVRFRLSKRLSTVQIDAVLSFGDTKCVYRGDLAGFSRGFMNCAGAGDIPISISIGE